MSTTKEDFQETIEARFREADAKIEAWRAELKQIEADTEVEYQRRLDELDQQRNGLREKLSELRDSGEDTWENLQDGINHAWDDLKRSVDDVTARFRKKD